MQSGRSSRRALPRKQAATGDARPSREALLAARDRGIADVIAPQLKVLFLLYADGSAPMSRLASSLGVTLSTVTGIVDRLVEHKLVQRREDPTDRRLVLCRLTPRANTMVERLHQAGRLRLGNVLADISLEDLRTVTAAMEVLAAAFGRQATAADLGEAAGTLAGAVRTHDGR